MSERADWLKSRGFLFGGHRYTLDSREQVHIPPLEKGNPSSQLPQKGKCVWPPSSCHLNHLPIQAFPWQGTTAKSRKTSLGRHPVATIRVVRACFKVRLDVRSGNMETLPKSLPQNITAVGVYPVISIGFYLNKSGSVLWSKKTHLLTSFRGSKGHIFRRCTVYVYIHDRHTKFE